jgi:uncharacterized membrane protein HdeD (DUF308 family)
VWQSSIIIRYSECRILSVVTNSENEDVRSLKRRSWSGNEQHHKDKETANMQDPLKDFWWLILLRGICAILFGVLAFVWPGITLAGLVGLFGVFAIANGIFSVTSSIQMPGGTSGRGSLGFEGVLSIIAGVLAFIYPGLTALSLLFLIALWAIITGIGEIVFAVKLRQVLPHEWLLVLSGLLSVVFGVLLFARPGPGALSVIWIIGAYAIIYGVSLLVAAYRLKKFAGHITPATA